MPNQNGFRVPKYRRHFKGYAFVRVKGRDYYLGAFNSDESHQAYKRIVAEFIERKRLAGDAGRPDRLDADPVKPDLTINELILRFLKERVDSYYVKSGRPTKEVAGFRLALRPLRLLYGHTPAAEFGPLALRRVRQSMIAGFEYVENGTKKAGIRCRSVANKDTSRIRAMFKWAAANEILPVRLYEALKTLEPLKRGRTDAKEGEPVAPVPLEQVEATLPHVSKQVAAMIRLQLLTGARPGEIISIRPVDVAMGTEGVWIYTPSSHKTQHHDKARKVFLGPKAQEELRPWLDRDPESYCFSAAEAEVARNLLKRSKRRSPMTPSQRKRNARSRSRGRANDRYTVDTYRRAIARACNEMLRLFRTGRVLILDGRRRAVRWRRRSWRRGSLGSVEGVVGFLRSSRRKPYRCWLTVTRRRRFASVLGCRGRRCFTGGGGSCWVAAGRRR